MKKCVSVVLAVVVILTVSAVSFGISRGIYYDQLETACETDGWYETQNYRLVCQDINE